MNKAKFAKKIDKAIDAYLTDTGDYPTDLERARIVLALRDARVDADKDVEGIDDLTQFAERVIVLNSEVETSVSVFDDEINSLTD